MAPSHGPRSPNPEPCRSDPASATPQPSPLPGAAVRLSCPVPRSLSVSAASPGGAAGRRESARAGGAVLTSYVTASSSLVCAASTLKARGLRGTSILQRYCRSGRYRMILRIIRYGIDTQYSIASSMAAFAGADEGPARQGAHHLMRRAMRR